MKWIKSICQAIFYVFLVVGLHLVVVSLLDIKIENFNTEDIKPLIKVYILPVLLSFINAFMFIRTLRGKFHIVWLLVSIIPSGLILLFFRELERTKVESDSMISLEFPKYSLEMFYLFPRCVFVIQLFLTVYYLVRRRKPVNRSKNLA
ncbi:hypothetical protein ACE6ED_05395 [Paenibacillus sp. CN-4]|uniref:hypothetical protein n=1 Tax=Paenibacillus nanchangensis TaxID=3348343 RepID=UPI00397E4EC1